MNLGQIPTLKVSGLLETRRLASYRSLSGSERPLIDASAAVFPACPAVFSGHHYLTQPQMECHHVHKRAL
jgi:hypothetical protein